jgi:hypothetical protein
MTPRKKIVLLGALALALALALPVCADDPALIELAPSHTRVGLAKVKLVVSDLTYRDDSVTGSYRIKIPLAPWRNDRGELHLELDEPLERIMTGGGTISGKGHSLENGRVHRVSCRFGTDGTVHITVQTHERRLDFKTRVKRI